MEIGLKGGLTRGMVGARATINSMQKRGAEQLGCNLAKYPSRLKGASIEDGTWSRGTMLSFDRGQGHELLQRQEQDHVVPWVLHSDGADSSCMVPKTEGASRHMHLISKKHLMEELRRLNLRRRSWVQEALARGKRTRKQVLLKNMPQCCHSSCLKEAVRSGDCAGRGSGPGSRQWCTNCSEVGGLRELLGDGLS